MAEAKIEISLSRLGQLFNSLDPSPFHERDLDSVYFSRLLEVGFTEGGQEAQPVTWCSDRSSKFSFATEEQLAGEGSQELIAHIRPGQQARYLN